MSPEAENGTNHPQTWSARIMGAFTGPPSSTGGSEDKGDRPEILPQEERKAAMSGLDQNEAKWTLGALILATVAGIAIPLYFIAENKVTKDGKNSIAVAPDAKLLGGVILVLCVIGFAALWKRKRTLVAFDLFLLGFAFTLFVGLIGFAFILLGGFLMLRAWRLNKYGTTNSKVIAREAAARPRGRQRKEAAAKSTSKSASNPDVRKPPTASKRYTPKAPARKKIPKATE
ncbi:MAG: tetraspanin family protein [Acidimicrobiales bacterium]